MKIDFKLNSSNLGVASQEELNQKLSSQGGKKPAPGNYDFEIVDADFHVSKGAEDAFCANDRTWFNVSLAVKTAGDKEMKIYIQVPTSKLTYGPKNTYAVYKKFSEFMASIGKPVTFETLSKVVPTTFSDPKASLKGLRFNADVGFDGPHARYQDGGYVLIDARGEEVRDDEGVIKLPDYKSAAAYAQGLTPKLILKDLEMLKFHPAKVEVAETKEEDNDW